jgi:hypothetical protein
MGTICDNISQQLQEKIPACGMSPGKAAATYLPTTALIILLLWWSNSLGNLRHTTYTLIGTVQHIFVEISPYRTGPNVITWENLDR